MLIKLLPMQISKHWDELADSIRIALPPSSGYEREKALTELMKKLLAGRAQVWCGTQVNGDLNEFIILIAVTMPIWDTDGNKNLLIYSIYGYKPISEETYIEGFKTLQKFAKGEGCKKIIAYSRSHKILKVVEQLGGSAEYKVIELEVE